MSILNRTDLMRLTLCDSDWPILLPKSYVRAATYLGYRHLLVCAPMTDLSPLVRRLVWVPPSFYLLIRQEEPSCAACKSAQRSCKFIEWGLKCLPCRENNLQCCFQDRLLYLTTLMEVRDECMPKVLKDDSGSLSRLLGFSDPFPQFSSY